MYNANMNIHVFYIYPKRTFTVKPYIFLKLTNAYFYILTCWYFNSLLHMGDYSVRMAKISIFK